MPFDGTHFEPPPPPRDSRSETAVCVVIALLAVGLLLLPVSLPAVGDLARYLAHHR